MDKRFFTRREKMIMIVLAFILAAICVLTACAPVGGDNNYAGSDDEVDVSHDTENDVDLSYYFNTSFDTGIEVSECGHYMISASAISDFDEYFALCTDVEIFDSDLINIRNIAKD